MRTIRAVLPISLTWGAVWASVGAVIAVVEWLRYVPLELASLPRLPSQLVAPMTILGTAGFLGGTVFGLLLARREQGKTLETLSTARIAAWGAVGGITFVFAGLALGAALFGIADTLAGPELLWFGAAAGCGAISAAGSLAIARKGTPGLLEEAAEMQRLGSG